MFVRLSTQSAKDVGRDRCPEQTVYEEYKKLAFAPDLNSKAIAMLNAASSVMRVCPPSLFLRSIFFLNLSFSFSFSLSAAFNGIGLGTRRLALPLLLQTQVYSGNEAIRLLASSDRINRSIIHALSQEFIQDNTPREGKREVEGKEAWWDLQIIVRKWINKIKLGREFRGFVCKGEMRAICQYNEWCYYADLLGQKKSIVQRIMKCFDALKEKVRTINLSVSWCVRCLAHLADSCYNHFQVPLAYKETAYVIDFALIGGKEDGEVKMVEINPFGPATGAALFDWEKDRKLLTGGQYPWKRAVGEMKDNEEKEKKEQKGESGVLNDFPFIEQTLWRPKGDGEFEEVTTAGEEGEARPLYFRLLSAPNPSVDSAFISSFGIHIYLHEGGEEEDSEDEDNEEEEDDVAVELDEFVDIFVNNEKLQGWLNAVT